MSAAAGASPAVGAAGLSVEREVHAAFASVGKRRRNAKLMETSNWLKNPIAPGNLCCSTPAADCARRFGDRSRLVGHGPASAVRSPTGCQAGPRPSNRRQCGACRPGRRSRADPPSCPQIRRGRLATSPARIDQHGFEPVPGSSTQRPIWHRVRSRPGLPMATKQGCDPCEPGPQMPHRGHLDALTLAVDDAQRVVLP